MRFRHPRFCARFHPEFGVLRLAEADHYLPSFAVVFRKGDLSNASVLIGPDVSAFARIALPRAFAHLLYAVQARSFYEFRFTSYFVRSAIAFDALLVCPCSVAGVPLRCDCAHALFACCQVYEQDLRGTGSRKAVRFAAKRCNFT